MTLRDEYAHIRVPIACSLKALGHSLRRRRAAAIGISRVDLHKFAIDVAETRLAWVGRLREGQGWVKHGGKNEGGESHVSALGTWNFRALAAFRAIHKA